MTRHTSQTPISLEVIHDLSTIDAEDWNQGTDPNDPFTDHAFLALLEESKSVGRQSGWVPVHLIAKQEDRIVGSAPLYLKNNSYGEYIFDWGWAESAYRAQIPYYPKVVCAVPFTPATGRRLLSTDAAVRQALVDGMHSVVDATKAHSLHILFLTKDEHSAVSERPEMIGRHTHQFQWDNNQYKDFDDWLSRLRSRRRKEIRRERAAPQKTGVEVRMLTGDAITADHWSQLRLFYRNTVQRKHATAYLTDEFFSLAHTRLAHSATVFVAEKDNTMVAAALCFQRGQHLYGRYWGCLPDYRSLHFELCYHAPIQACIENGWQHFEAGAQGMHKLQRGLLPVRTYSVHHLRHGGLHRAVEQAVEDENHRVREELSWLNSRSPFHRE